MEEGVNDRKDYNNEKNDEYREGEFPDDTPHVDIEEGVSDRKMTRMKKTIRKKRHSY